MRHVLHLLKDPGHPAALRAIRAQAGDPEVRLSVVLMHPAAPLAEPLPGEVYRLDPRPRAGDDPDPRRIDHAGLLELVFAADAVVSW